MAARSRRRLSRQFSFPCRLPLADKNYRKPSEWLALAAIFLGRRNNNSWTQELQSAAKPEGE
jgi:hypothetical protein